MITKITAPYSETQLKAILHPLVNKWFLSKSTSRESILKVRKFAVNLHKSNGGGQRTISSEIKKTFGIVVSVIIAINWLRYYNLPVRSHTQSMNTPSVKQELGRIKLKHPTKDYRRLTPAKAYILGVLCGDGYIDKKQIRLEIRKDKEFITAFSNSIKEVYGVRYNWKFYSPRNTYLLGLSSMIIAKDLLRYGNFRTWTWFAPKEIVNSKNKEIIASFVRGVYDSEGSVGSYTINLTTASTRGVRHLRLLLKKLGIRGRIGRWKKYSHITITGKKNIKLFDKLVGLTILRKTKKLHSMYKLGWEK